MRCRDFCFEAVVKTRGKSREYTFQILYVVSLQLNERPGLPGNVAQMEPGPVAQEDEQRDTTKRGKAANGAQSDDVKTETDSERHKMTTQRRSTTTTVHETMTRRPRGTTKTQSVDIETRKRLQRRDMTTTRHKSRTTRERLQLHCKSDGSRGQMGFTQQSADCHRRTALQNTIYCSFSFSVSSSSRCGTEALSESGHPRPFPLVSPSLSHYLTNII
ncbi:Hypothetical protein SMAX5B_005924 [Scophthalmus maximus]|uniref:Uncharacterized protein n=1 Tax=Scophthalmus maximus TaxID=52904 RepID=A0A2U9CRT9_SCOMX|nr:Hypothetical protein SMAX5B_005924 [Scophthalmus maximus]